jgi:hypothetical protein
MLNRGVVPDRIRGPDGHRANGVSKTDYTILRMFVSEIMIASVHAVFYNAFEGTPQ